jgi:hypothetical protein
MRETPERQVVKRKGLIESKIVTSNLLCHKAGWGDGVPQLISQKCLECYFILLQSLTGTNRLLGYFIYNYNYKTSK